MHVIIGFKHWNGVNNLLLLIFMTTRISFDSFHFVIISGDMTKDNNNRNIESERDGENNDLQFYMSQRQIYKIHFSVFAVPFLPSAPHPSSCVLHRQRQTHVLKQQEKINI